MLYAEKSATASKGKSDPSCVYTVAMSIEYKLCTAETAAELNREVNELLNEGWALYGNPFPSSLKNGSSDTTRNVVCQALTKMPKKVAGVR